MKKGWKKGTSDGGFTVALFCTLFCALFSSPFLPELHVGPPFFSVFYVLFFALLIEKGEKKLGKKKREWQKGQKKRA
jgi:hypothetical protein